MFGGPRRGEKFVFLPDERTEQRIYMLRWRVMAFLVVLAAILLVGRYTYLQVVQHGYYRAHSDRNRIHVRQVSPVRGLIYDRDGGLIADSRTVLTLVVVPEQVPDLDGALETLRDLMGLKDSEIERFQYLLEQRPSFAELPLRTGLSDEDIARLAVEQHRMPGVDIRARLVRRYYHGQRYAHLVGHMGAITAAERRRLNRGQYRGTYYIGKVGLEQAYESILHGEPGHEQVEVNAWGRVLRVLEYQPAVSGQDLHLHVDSRVQLAAMAALAGRRGAVVVLDPRDGGVIAAVSSPGFDPDQFAVGMDAEQFGHLQNSPDKPLFNRALQGLYAPASAFKPVIALAGLHYDAIDAERRISDIGYYILGGRRYRDWLEGGHGQVDMRRSLVESCDTYYYLLAESLGIKRIASFASRFGFGTVTGVDLRGETSGIMPDRAWKSRRHGEPWYIGDTLNVGIGQGYMLVTPMQMAVMAAMLANRGRPVVPRLVRRVGNNFPLPPPVPPPLLEVAPEHWDVMHNALEDVVHSPAGTAHNIASGALYRMAGKTGTVQVIGLVEEEEGAAVPAPRPVLQEELRDHAVFIGYAPADDPRLAVAVVVENGGHGGRVAAPIARRIFDAWLQQEFADSLASPAQSLQANTSEQISQ